MDHHPVSNPLRQISENISKLVQVSPKNSNFFGECFIVFKVDTGFAECLLFKDKNAPNHLEAEKAEARKAILTT